MNRIKETIKLFPKLHVFGFIAFSLLVTWLLTYQRTLEYFVDKGTSIEAIGHANILWSTLDGTVILFSLLVFIVAGIIPFISVLIKPTPKTSAVAQIVWLLLIVGLLYFDKATS